MHHLLCPHTHQQYGAIEAKHGHIVETGLALLAQASKPVIFWDEVCMAVCYLINRLPSKVIGNSTPLDDFPKLLRTIPFDTLLGVYISQTYGH